MKTITVKMDDRMVEQIEEYAHDKGATVSSVIRSATGEFLSGKRPNRLMKRVGDLVGCIKAPADLSTSPKQLKGYGH